VTLGSIGKHMNHYTTEVTKTGLLHPFRSYQKDGNSTLTSVVSLWSALKSDYVSVVSPLPVFQESLRHL
jgi:hypothetical protein